MWKEELRKLLAGAPKKYRELAMRAGSSRVKAVEYIHDNGGYSARHERFAVSFNVKAYGADLSLDRLYTLGIESEMSDLPKCYNDGERGVRYGYFCETYRRYQDRLFDTATEDAWSSFRDSLHTFYEDRPDIVVGLRGRCSGHLVVERCEGIDLCVSPDELRDRLLERDTAMDGRFASYVVDDYRVMRLFLLCVQYDLDLTTDAVGREVEYQAASFVWGRMDREELIDRFRTYRNMDVLAEELDTIPLPEGSPLREKIRSALRLFGAAES